MPQSSKGSLLSMRIYQYVHGIVMPLSGARLLPELQTEGFVH